MFAVHLMGALAAVVIVNLLAEQFRLRTVTSALEEDVRRCEIEHDYPPGTLKSSSSNEQPSISWRLWLEKEYSSSRLAVRISDAAGLLASTTKYLSFVLSALLVWVMMSNDNDPRWIWLMPAGYGLARLCIGLFAILIRVATGMYPSMGSHMRKMISTIDEQRGVT